MQRYVVGLLAAVAVVVGTSTLATWSFGRFKTAAAGEPSYAFATDAPATPLDRQVATLSGGRDDRTGILLVPANTEAFAARVLLLRAAERSLDTFYYIWQDDLTGNFLLQELAEAAARGVRVRLLLDDIGIDALDAVLAGLDARDNIEVRIFNPAYAREGALQRGLEMALRFSSMNRRMHNKAWIADGSVGIVGGRNIGDAYFDADETAHFNDLDLVVTGPVLRDTEALFDAFWNSGLALPIAALSRHAPLSDRELESHFPERLNPDALEPYLVRIREGTSAAAYLDPGRFRFSDSARLLADPPAKARDAEQGNWMIRDLEPVLASARRSIEIMSPYFVPREEGTAWFVAFAQAGVAVSVLTNSLAATDVAAVHGGYAPFREPLLKGGVKLFELRSTGGSEAFSLQGSTNASLHTKAFTVDDRLAFVGSLNFDPRSASLNTEMGVLFEVPELVAEIRALFALETSPEHSYAVRWTQGGLRWFGEEDGQEVVLDSEPQASLSRRVIAGIVALLPLDSQL